LKIDLIKRLKKADIDGNSRVWIWLHPTKRHAIEGGTNWIAMVSKSFDGKSIVFDIDSKKFNAFINPTNEILYKKSLEEREEIYLALNYVIKFSQNEADKEHLNPNDWEKNYDYNEKLLDKYYEKLYTHYSITEEVSNKIFIEGIEKGWLEKTGDFSFKIK